MKNISDFLQKCIFCCYLALVGITPLIFYPFTKYFPFPWIIFGIDPVNFELFEFNKMLFVYGISIVVAALWTIRSIYAKKVIFRHTWFDIPILLFLITQILSTLFSIDIHTSLWGYYSRFHGGLVSTLAYLLLYWAFVSNLDDKKYVLGIIKWSVISATLVALYGIAQRAGIDASMWVQNVRARVFSTLGQPNWLAAYLAAMFPFALALFSFKNNLLSKLLYGLAIITLIPATLFTGSRSGLLALTLAIIFYTWIILIKNKNLSTKKIIYTLPIVAIIAGLYTYTFFEFTPQASLISLLFLVITTAISVYPFAKIESQLLLLALVITALGTYYFVSPETFRIAPAGTPSTPAQPALDTAGAETGKIRLIVWQGAWDIFKKYPLIGSGVETFAYSFYEVRPTALLATSEWDFLYNKAHNEFLNVLATTGSIGFTVYAAFLLGMAWVLGKNILQYKQALSSQNQVSKLLNKNSSENSTAPIDLLIYIACASSLITIFITNFFGFSVVNIGLLFFLIPAFVMNLNPEHKHTSILSNLMSKIQKKPKLTFLNNYTTVIVFAVIAVAAFFLIHLFRYYFADIEFRRGRDNIRNGYLTRAQTRFANAIKLRDIEPSYYAELGWTQANLVSALLEQKDGSTAAELAPLAQRNIQTSLGMAPNNINYWKKAAGGYAEMILFSEEYNDDLTFAMQQVTKLAPTDAAGQLMLTYYHERLGEIDQAITLTDKILPMRPNFHEAYFRKAQLYNSKYAQSKNPEDLKIAKESQQKAQELAPDIAEYQTDL